jgi:glycerol-3-phosphate cytidylyltransferase
MKRVLVYGTFDLFHYGHLELLKKSKELYDDVFLIVGVNSDDYVKRRGKKNIIACEHRCAIVKSIKYVDECFVNNCDYEDRENDIINKGVDIVVVNEESIDKFNYLNKRGIKVMTLPRTPNISTSIIKNKIKDGYE